MSRRALQGVFALQGELLSQHDQARPTLGISGGIKFPVKNSHWFFSLTIQEIITYAGDGLFGGFIDFPAYLAPSVPGVGYCWTRSCLWFNLHLLGVLIHPFKFEDIDFLPSNTDSLNPQTGLVPISLRYSYAFHTTKIARNPTMWYLFLELKTLLIPMSMNWYDTPRRGYYFDGYTSPPLFISAGVELDWKP